MAYTTTTTSSLPTRAEYLHNINHHPAVALHPSDKICSICKEDMNRPLCEQPTFLRLKEHIRVMLARFSCSSSLDALFSRNPGRAVIIHHQNVTTAPNAASHHTACAKCILQWSRKTNTCPVCCEVLYRPRDSDMVDEVYHYTVIPTPESHEGIERRINGYVAQGEIWKWYTSVARKENMVVNDHALALVLVCVAADAVMRWNGWLQDVNMARWSVKRALAETVKDMEEDMGGLTWMGMFVEDLKEATAQACVFGRVNTV